MYVSIHAGPVNPTITPEYEPRPGSMDLLMLCAALRSLAVKAGTTVGAVEKLQEVLHG